MSSHTTSTKMILSASKIDNFPIAEVKFPPGVLSSGAKVVIRQSRVKNPEPELSSPCEKPDASSEDQAKVSTPQWSISIENGPK